MLKKLLITLFLISTSFIAISDEKNKNTEKELEANGDVEKLDNDNNKLKQAIDAISKIGTDEMKDNDGSTTEQNRNDPAVQNASPVPSEDEARSIFDKFIFDPLLGLIFGKDYSTKSVLEKEAESLGLPKDSTWEEVLKESDRLADLYTEPIDRGPNFFERLANTIVGFFSK